MLYAEMSSGGTLGGHVGNDIFNNQFSPKPTAPSGYHVIKIQADGDELDRCFSILGRTRNYATSPVHLFMGDAAQEIALNWFN